MSHRPSSSGQYRKDPDISMKTTASSANPTSSHTRRSRNGIVCAAALALVAGSLPAGNAAEEAAVVAVSAKVSPDYVRTKLPDGKFAAEHYTFGNGGRWAGPMRDLDFEKMKFDDVVRDIAPPLRERNYLPGLEPKKVNLLIMVYWGTTDGSGGSGREVVMNNLANAQASLSRALEKVAAVSQASGNVTQASGWSVARGSLFLPGTNQEALVARIEADDAESEFDAVLAANRSVNRQRDRMLVQNAGMLGYDSELEAADSLGFVAGQVRRQDIVDELEDNRYFVVLMAYDFPLLMKEKKAKLLWETRYSVRQRGLDFSKSLAAITEQASRYFGQDSHGLLRKPLPEGHVTLGKLEVGAVVPDK